VEEHVGPGVFSRRTFVGGASAAAVATLLGQLPRVLGDKGLLEAANAQSADIVDDTLSGLVAFILPGNDAYSTAQGVSTNEPGGIGAGTVPVFRANLDAFVPASVFAPQGLTVPSSGGVAMLLNDFALQVNPGASSGPFASPFARLKHAEKAEVLKRFEADTTITENVQELNFVAGILPGFVGFLVFSEAGVLDPATRQPTSRPVGWTLSQYRGPAEGHAELRGYYQDRKAAVKPRKRRRRRRRRRRPS
jgi:hypothetical protein